MIPQDPSHDAGHATGDGEALDLGQQCQAVLFGKFARADEQRGGAIGHGRGGAGGNGSILRKDGLQVLQLLQRGFADAAVISNFDAADSERGDSGYKASVLLRSTSLGVAGEGEAILIIARDGFSRHRLIQSRNYSAAMARNGAAFSVITPI